MSSANKAVCPPDRRFSIRDARPDELDKVIKLVIEAFSEYEKAVPPAVWKSYIKDITDAGNRLRISQLIVAEADGQLAGSVTLYPDTVVLPDSGWPPGWALIRLLAVQPGHRGKGIGRALVAECINRCRRQGIRTIALHTAIMMGVAVRMYEKIGFTRAPEFDFSPRPGTVVMAYRYDKIK